MNNKNGDKMHKIDVPSKNIRTDLIIEDEKSKNKVLENDYFLITESKKDKGKYTTIEYQDITDREECIALEKVLKKELIKYISPKKEDKYLVIGLGNAKSTPDSLGPKTVDKIIVTRYLYLLGEIDERYSNVSIYKPDVCGNTGIESLTIIKSIIKEIKPTKVIVIDALKASKLNRLIKTIQITDTGIHPGSGIMNNQGEISSTTVNAKVIAIGVPTVVDKNTMLEKEASDNFMVTPTNIDFVIERLATLLGNTLNSIFHQSIFDK